MNSFKKYETSETTFYEVKFKGTKDNIKNIIGRFVHNNRYGLDTKGNGLFYSCFDSKSISEVCFSYDFPDENTVRIMCWIQYRKIEYKLDKIFINLKLEIFRRKKLKEFKELITLIRYN